MAESMIELHLQSSEGENVIVFVTAEDAARVVNDPKFAKRVANAALRRTHDTFQTQVVSDNISEDEERQEEETGEMMNQPKKYFILFLVLLGGAKWNSAATLLLLHEYSEKESLFKSGKRTHRFYWEEIAKIMRSKGYTFSWGQISSKMDSLKRRYKKIKDASKQSGNGRIPNWEFYETMEKIFGQRPWVTPLSTASSSGPSNDTSDSCLIISIRHSVMHFSRRQEKKEQGRGARRCYL
ncbi:uncharacterized protein [Temnothorax longispinosus]|uniref:uncharacterized protein n=1 Tax=Temnothorax longispinosus TaxID=300112 RepID=UPI003A998B0C